MAIRRSSSALAGLVVLGLVALLAVPCFVQPSEGARSQVRSSQAPAGQVPTVVGLTAASWLAASQPAFAEAPQYPGWPYVLIFVTVFAALFIIPNTIWK
mmetsp:Transcript_17675/g.39908  ORF Transcript_17675/g.39908 Transcript_17675/m.39908 type:complete len:99 (+) Transcript_17675:71-367(+)